MLDTNVCIEFLRKGSPRLMSRLRKHEPDEIALSGITLAELRFGAAKSSRPVHHELLLAQFCAPLQIVPFDQQAAGAYGQVRADLERRGTPIGPLDTLIAAHALALRVTLVTSNLREFKRVSGLRVEDWLGE